MIGPAGYGSSNFVADAGTALPYQIDFENAPTATAPAQAVTITDQLDPNLNWSTFQLTGIGWGDTILTIPAGSQHYETTVPMTYNGADVRRRWSRPASTPPPGRSTPRSRASTRTPHLPPDVLTGFLPPEDGTGRGRATQLHRPAQGRPGHRHADPQRGPDHLRPESGHRHRPGQRRRPQPRASTRPSRPSSRSTPARPPAASPAAGDRPRPRLHRQLVRQDDTGGSGIGSYTIYVSDNGGPFTPWLIRHTHDLGHLHAGQRPHLRLLQRRHGQRRQRPADPRAAQATTAIDAPIVGSTISVQASEDPAAPGDSVTFTATVTPGDSTNGTPTGTIQFQVAGTDVGSPVPLTDGSASFTDSELTIGHHAVTAIYTSDNGLFDTSTGTLPGGESCWRVSASSSLRAPRSLPTARR